VTVEVTTRGGDEQRAAYLPTGKRRRRSAQPFAIQAFVGANGGGKTLAVVELVVLPAWEAGRLVVSNMALYPEALGFPAELYQPLRSWREIVKMGRCMEADPCTPGECPHSSTRGHGCALVLDEASAVLPSRAAGTVPHQLIRVLNQLRKRDVTLAWTAPAYARMDLAVRETTQAVTVCTGLLRDRWVRDQDVERRRRFPRKARDENGQAVRVERGWAPNRLFTWATYEAMSYDEFTLGKTQQLRPRARRTYWRPRHRAQFAYRSMEGVEMLDHVDASGACMDCGLPRKRKSCACSDHGTGGAPQGPQAPEAAATRQTGPRRLGAVW
jgi:hypothetical protein